MGLSVSQKLAAKGANIIIVSRNVSKLEAAIESIRAAAKSPSSQRFHHISTDVGSPNYATAVVEEATRWNNGRSLDIVWCIAGMARPELFIDAEMSSIRQQMDVNFFGTAEMAHAILKKWLHPGEPIEKDPKHLIMTSSVVAFYTIPGYSPYSPSKCALRGLADTLAQEVMLYPQNVKVEVVFPGTILSPGYSEESKTKPEITKILEESDPKGTPDQVAEAAISGLESGEYFVSVSWLGELMRLLSLGSSFRNNWILDILGVCLTQVIVFFVQLDLVSKTKAFGRKNGHPSTWTRKG